MIITHQDIKHLNLTGLRVGLTSGCFDLLHFYHLHYLQQCKANCEFLIVGVDSNALLTHFKSKQSCIPEYQRVAMVEALKCVDAVFLMRNLDQFQEMADRADVIFKNEPTLYGKPIVGGIEKLMVIPDVIEMQSTSEIVARIQAGLGAVTKDAV